jgi:2,4-dienoyl-CoA reductase (NADPH2)
MKVAAGQAARVRTCISCENCIDAMEQRFSVDCAVNPRTGKERELTARRAQRGKRVTVIGSGPAGLEAARVSAERGHRVTLFERNDQMGGALVWASILHPENEPFLRYLRDEIHRSTVNVVLGHEVCADDVVEQQPDAVVVANGGRVVLPAIEGSSLPNVHSGAAAVRAVTRGLLEGHRVAIVGGSLAALELAEFLAARGRLVTVLDSGKVVAPEIGNKRKTEHMDRLDRLGVTVHVRAEVMRIDPTGVVFTPAGGSSRRLPADTVVVAGALQANTDLHEKLAAALPDVKVAAAGDCTGLGLIRKATEGGARAACAI